MARGGVKATCSLPEDLNSVPNTHLGSRESLPSSGVSRHLHSLGIYLYTQTLTLTSSKVVCTCPAVRRLMGSGVTTTCHPFQH